MTNLFNDVNTPSNLEIGDQVALREGKYRVSYIYWDMQQTAAELASGDTRDTCTYQLKIASGVVAVCNDNVNLSLSAGCQATLQPDDILENDDNCTLNFTVNILEGANAGTNTLDASYLGQTVRVEVRHTDDINGCWGYVTVEDKIKPSITCVPDMVIYCGQTSDPVSYTHLTLPTTPYV